MGIKAFFTTDGSCRPTNPGFCGAGIFGYTFKVTEKSKNIKHPIHASLYFTKNGIQNTKDEDNLELIEIYEIIKSINNPFSTNNDAELYAFITALEKTDEIEDLDEVTIHTDSNYIVTSFNENLEKWKSNNWKRLDNKPIVHQRDWEIIDDYKKKFKERNIPINVRWVKGHAEDYCNYLADIYSIIGSNSSRKQLENNVTNFNDTVLDIKSTYSKFKESFINKDIIFFFRDLYFSSNEINDNNYCFLSNSENQNTVGKRDTSSIFASNIGYVPEVVNKFKQIFRSIERNYITTCCIKLNKLDNKDIYRLSNLVDPEYLLVKNTNGKALSYNLVGDGTPFIFENGMEYPFIINAVGLFDRMNYIDQEFESNSNSDIIIKDITEKLIEDNKLSFTNKVKEIDFSDIFKDDINIRQKLFITLGYDIPSYLALKNIESKIKKISLILYCKQDTNFCTLYTRIETDDRHIYSINIENKFLKNSRTKQ